jgi:hypothetical protein
MPHHDTKANALMVTSSFDRLSGTSATASSQPYNNFRVQTLGGNIIQGQVNRIRVGEVYFPYQIPTIIGVGGNAGSTGNLAKNSTLSIVFFKVVTPAVPGPASITNSVLLLSVPTGYYTAAEIQTYIQAQITAFEASRTPTPVPAGSLVLSLDPATNALTFQNTAAWDPAANAVNWLFYVAPFLQGVGTAKTLQAPNLAWTLGFRQVAAAYPPVLPGGTNLGPGNTTGPVLVPTGYPNNDPNFPIFLPGYGPNYMTGSTYLGRYTDYIDLCSPTLCQAQYVRDGNTNQATIRRDQICRLYIADEISVYTADAVGTRPFIIHRQFKNAKVMKWTAERSIDAIDIQLYDMYGNPLPIPILAPIALAGNDYALNNGPGDFAITFLVEEQESELMSNADNIGYRM